MPSACIDPKVFDQAIIIPPTDSDEMSIPGIIELYSAGVVFNLALTHHFSVCSPSYRARILIQTHRLYDAVLALLNKVNGTATQYHPMARLLWLACVNNLGRIAISRSNYYGAQQFLRGHVASFCCLHGSSLDDPEVQGLLLGLLEQLDGSPQRATAAAA
jgi:hypothetical protein